MNSLRAWLPTFAAICACATFAYIVFATLAPLAERPATAMPANLERAGAFLLLGFLVGISQPRRRVAVALLVLAAVVLLEFTQGLMPDRHPRLADALVKIFASLAGLHTGFLFVLLSARRFVRVRKSASHER